MTKELQALTALHDAKYVEAQKSNQDRNFTTWAVQMAQVEVLEEAIEAVRKIQEVES